MRVLLPHSSISLKACMGPIQKLYYATVQVTPRTHTKKTSKEDIFGLLLAAVIWAHGQNMYGLLGH